MQLLATWGAESGPTDCLGLVPGKVVKLVENGELRLPHVGWNDVQMMDDPLFAGIDSFIAYYSNSYVAAPADTSEVIAWTQYGAERFPAAVRRDNVWGVQFHPEKSGADGIAILRRFVLEAGS